MLNQYHVSYESFTVLAELNNAVQIQVISIKTKSDNPKAQEPYFTHYFP